MVAAKFSIGQQVRHKTFGYLGVVVDVDPEYSLSQPGVETLKIDESLQHAPWYYVITEDSSGEAVQAYVAEGQLDREFLSFHPDQPILDDFASAVQSHLRRPGLRH